MELLNISNVNYESSYYDYPSVENGSDHDTNSISSSTELPVPEVRVMGGENAIPGEFPHHVYFTYYQNGQRWACSASIIHPLLLLTAAHCAYNVTPETIKVTAGEHQVRKTEGTEQNLRVGWIVVHKKYDWQSNVHDIAILVLENPIKPDNYTEVIPIPGPNQDLPDGAYLSGWGTTGDGTGPSRILQKAWLPILDTKECQRHFGGSRFKKIHDKILCAGGGGKSSCRGDSGSSLTCENKITGWKFLCGILSFGRNCEVQVLSRTYAPGVFVDVRKYHSWISKQMRIWRKHYLDSYTENSTGNQCSTGTFQCENRGICIPDSFRCDGVLDCDPILDDSDERNCTEINCPADSFACANKVRCIGQKLVCDGEDDCGDNSDEIHCSAQSLNYEAGHNGSVTMVETLLASWWRFASQLHFYNGFLL